MNLVLTIAIGDEYARLSSLTHPTIRAYADRIGAEFMSIDTPAISQTTAHWEKFQIYYLLEKYDRVLYIDTDIIIRDDCPDLFEVVPETHLGMFNEGRFTNRSQELMIDICKAYNVVLPDWDGNYYNSGVMVISKHHRSLFKKPDKEVPNFFEQSYLNMMIAKREVDMFELEHEFNRMTCMDRYTGEERFASYIIHYAGWYWKAAEIGAPSNVEYILDLIQKDLNRWQQDSPIYNYKRHIYISVTGGIGDQICAEPAIRFMREKMYPFDDFIVATHYPRLFKHLGVEVVEHGKARLKEDTPYFICESLPNPDTLQWSIVSHLLCHTVDYCSIALMHRTLPFLDRTIQFKVDDTEYESLFEKIGFSDVSDYTVIHAGKHWNSKTFPVEYWQEIINNTDKVILVGQTAKGDPPYYIAGARGTVDVDGSKVIDLREKLSIGEFGALLSKAKRLISNDSFPIHLAGAFDIEIVLIPSCKHPDHILPYRQGSIFYKAKAVYKRLVLDTLEARPTQVYPVSAEVEHINWSEYLEKPDKV